MMDLLVYFRNQATKHDMKEKKISIMWADEISDDSLTHDQSHFSWVPLQHQVKQVYHLVGST